MLALKFQSGDILRFFFHVCFFMHGNTTIEQGKKKNNNKNGIIGEIVVIPKLQMALISVSCHCKLKA